MSWMPSPYKLTRNAMLGSLKLRLALACALLIALSVAAMAFLAVRELQQGTEEALLGTNLGAAQLAATLSAAVVTRQRALAAAAQQWPHQQAAEPAAIENFLARQAALGVLFNRLSIAAQAGARASNPPPGRAVSVPLRGLAGADELELAILMPLPSGRQPAPVLAGMLDLRKTNFLTALVRAAGLDDEHVRTIVADQQGYVLAHADEQRLLSLVDEDPALRQAVARWRAMGSPLEPAPWSGKFDQNFVAMAAVPGTDWMVFRIADAEEIYGAARRAVNRTLAQGVGVGLAGALAIFGLTAWLLKPMGQLRRRALLALDTSYPPLQGWPETGGEVGELSRVLKHVSGQLAASRADIEQALQRMQAVMAHAPVGIAFTSENRIELASSQLERMLGYSKGELKCHWGELLAPDASRDALRDEAEGTFAKGQIFEAEIPLCRRDGSVLWAHVSGAAIFGAQRFTIWIVADVTEARRQREDLAWRATHDPLTELVNRREFERRLGQLVTDRRRHDAACAFFIDLDHFKQVNDSAGHAAGDTILKKVAQVLRDCVRAGDTVARLGGDEFAVLLPACGLERAMLIAEKMRYGIALEGVCEADPTLRVTASIGLVEIDQRLRSLAEVLEAADQACYAAKHAGRNAVRCAPLKLETEPGN
jgi:diguanylate cyclase (GGDEF)-like protein/PAS domain S-box-containing protein